MTRYVAPLTHLDANLIAAQYQSGASMNKLARMHGCSAETIKVRLVQAGVTQRATGVRLPDTATLLAHAAEGWTPDRIALHYGVTRGRVDHALGRARATAGLNPDYGVSGEQWMRDAACAVTGPTFATQPIGTQLATCTACPVIASCYKWARRQPGMDGVAGGVEWSRGKPRQHTQAA